MFLPLIIICKHYFYPVNLFYAECCFGNRKFKEDNGKCRIPIPDLSVEGLINNMGMFGNSSERAAKNSLHFIGHSWVVNFKLNSAIWKSTGIKISTEHIEQSDILKEMIHLAKTGAYKFLPNIVVFAGLTSAWQPYMPTGYPTAQFLEPNPRFNSKMFLNNLITLNDALLVHNRDTQLFVFLPPIVDIMTYNRKVMERNKANWSEIIFVRSQLQKENIIAHTYYCLSEFMPENFSSLPSNVSLLIGLDLFNFLSPPMLNSLREFMMKQLDTLYLSEFLSDGYHPTPALISQFFKTFAHQFGENTSDVISHESPQTSTKITKVSSREHLKEAAEIEFQNVVNHLLTVRDMCYRGVKNDELFEIGVSILKKQLLK